MKIAAWWEDGQRKLMEEIFLHSPPGEDIELSLARLARAIAHDGIGGTYSPWTIWHAYRHHPELSRNYDEVMVEWRLKRIAMANKKGEMRK